MNLERDLQKLRKELSKSASKTIEEQEDKIRQLIQQEL